MMVSSITEEVSRQEHKVQYCHFKVKRKNTQYLKTIFSDINFHLSLHQKVLIALVANYADQLLKSCIESGSNPSDTLYVGDMDVDINVQGMQALNLLMHCGDMDHIKSINDI